MGLSSHGSVGHGAMASVMIPAAFRVYVPLLEEYIFT